MSQKTARRERQNGSVTPTEVESQPSLDDYISELIGDDELATTLAGRIASLLMLGRRLEGEMKRLSLTPEDRMPGWAPEDDGEVSHDGKKYLSYKQQRERLRATVADEMAQAESENVDKKVKTKVPEQAQKLIAREEAMLDAQARSERPMPEPPTPEG